MEPVKILQAAITLLSLVNPLVCALLLAPVVAGQTTTARFTTASRACIAIFVILAIFALAGAKLLKVFGISLDVFQVAGGLVLAWMGFNMVRASSGVASAEHVPTEGQAASPSLTPLILFAASPGTITGVITLAVNHTGTALPVTALLGAAIAVFVLWIVLLLASRLVAGASGASDASGESLTRTLASGMMGLIVIAMGFQFAMSGAKAFFGH